MVNSIIFGIIKNTCYYWYGIANCTSYIVRKWNQDINEEQIEKGLKIINTSKVMFRKEAESGKGLPKFPDKIIINHFGISLVNLFL